MIWAKPVMPENSRNLRATFEAMSVWQWFRSAAQSLFSSAG
jgi:hypothetical protein